MGRGSPTQGVIIEREIRNPLPAKASGHSEIKHRQVIHLVILQLKRPQYAVGPHNARF